MSTLIDHMQQIRNLLQQQVEGAAPTASVAAAVSKALLATTSDPLHERVLVRYTTGGGRRRFGPDGTFITLQMWMFDLDQRPDGYHEGVWQALFSSPADLLAVPSQPTEPLNQPVGPVPVLPPLATTKAHWTFGDTSSNFSVACSQILTEGGTGWFKGAHGLKQSLGATRVGPGENFFDPSATGAFSATTIDTFRIVWPGGVPDGFAL
jgi:hypothetical protein